MSQGSLPDPWWVRVFYILIGALISALVGWVSSLYNHYRDSRKHHSQELKQHVLEPLRAATATPALTPNFEISFGPQTYNPNVGVSEYPVSHGPVLLVHEPEIILHRVTETALLQDARKNHYMRLIARWEKFVESVSDHSRHRRELLESLAQDILTSSGLPAHPAKDHNGPYVMQLQLAMVAYGRLMKFGETALKVEQHPDGACLTTGGGNCAKGQPVQVKALLQKMDDLIVVNRDRAAQFVRELAVLTQEQSALVAAFSYEIAARRLPGRCDLVPFWQL
jgi:hypothetical protein